MIHTKQLTIVTAGVERKIDQNGSRSQRGFNFNGNIFIFLQGEVYCLRKWELI